MAHGDYEHLLGVEFEIIITTTNIYILMYLFYVFKMTEQNFHKPRTMILILKFVFLYCECQTDICYHSLISEGYALLISINFEFQIFFP